MLVRRKLCSSPCTLTSVFNRTRSTCKPFKDKLNFDLLVTFVLCRTDPHSSCLFWRYHRRTDCKEAQTHRQYHQVHLRSHCCQHVSAILRHVHPMRPASVRRCHKHSRLVSNAHSAAISLSAIDQHESDAERPMQRPMQLFVLRLRASVRANGRPITHFLQPLFRRLHSLC